MDFAMIKLYRIYIYILNYLMLIIPWTSEAPDLIDIRNVLFLGGCNLISRFGVPWSDVVSKASCLGNTLCHGEIFQKRIYFSLAVLCDELSEIEN